MPKVVETLTKPDGTILTREYNATRKQITNQKYEWTGWKVERNIIRNLILYYANHHMISCYFADDLIRLLDRNKHKRRKHALPLSMSRTFIDEFLHNEFTYTLQFIIIDELLKKPSDESTSGYFLNNEEVQRLKEIQSELVIQIKYSWYKKLKESGNIKDLSEFDNHLLLKVVAIGCKKLGITIDKEKGRWKFHEEALSYKQ